MKGQQAQASRVVPVRLDDAMVIAIDARSRQDGTTRSHVIREALAAHLAGASSVGRLTLSRTQVERVREIAERFGVERLDLFGSFARGEGTASSDVDLLYTLRPGVRLGWAIEDLATELTTVLGHPVDLVARRALHPRLRDSVLGEAEVLYAA